MMRTKASSSRYRNQEILEELFDEINDYLGDRDIPLVEQYPPSAPSNKTAVETTTEPSTPLSSSDKNQPEPILVESEESEEEEDDNYNTYHRQQQSLAHSTPTQHNHHNRRQSNTTSSQQESDCLLLCSVTNESLSVCMCYSCKKNKSEEVYQAIPTKKSSSRSKQQPRRSWTSAATNGFGLGGMLADRVKQTFAYSNNNNTKPVSPFTTSKQQQYENRPGYEEPRKRSSSREGSGRKRWIPRPKSLPAISAYVQKRQVYDDNEIDDDDDDIYEEEEETRKHRRPSWSSKKSKHNSRRSSRRSSIYNNNNDDYNEDDNYYVNDVNDNNDYNKKRASAILFDGISEKYEMETKQQKMDYYYQEMPEPQQQEQVSHHYQMYDSNSYGEKGVIEQQYQEPVQLQNPSSVSLSQQQYQPFQQQQQQQSSEQQPIMDQSFQHYVEQQQNPQQFLTEPLQTSPVTTTPLSLPALTELPFLTPATRVGEEHYPLKMKDSRALPTKQERMNAYNNAYYHCIMAKTNLIPWLTKQYSKGPPDTMFEYTPKPKKTSKKLFSIFKLCNTGNKDGSKPNTSTSLSTSNNSQIPWQPSVSPSHLISPPTSASPNSASILTNSSSIHNQQQHQHGLQQTMTATGGWPINSNSTNSSLLSPAPPLLGSTSEISMSPSSNTTSTFTPISAADDGGANYYQHNDYSKMINTEQPQVKEEEVEEEPFEPVLPRPRSFCSSNISFNSNNFENRPSRSSGISFASTTKSDIRPVSILKKSRSSASLQPQSNKFYSDNDDDEDEEEDNYYEDCNRGNSRSRKFLEAPTQQQRRSPRRGHVKRRSFSQVEEPIYYMDRRRRNSYQQIRQQPRRSSSRGSFQDQEQEEIYEDDLVMDDDDALSEEEYQLVQDMNDRPRRILSRARPNSGFYHSGRLNHLRSSRGPPPVWVPAENEPQYEDDIVADTFLPPTTRRQRRISGGRRPSRPSSRNSIVVYDDMIPIPAPRASPVYYY